MYFTPSTRSKQVVEVALSARNIIMNSQRSIPILLFLSLIIHTATTTIAQARPQQDTIRLTSQQDKDANYLALQSSLTGECGAHHLCQNGGTCVEGANNYTCACPEGFSGPYCSQDINECARRPSVCQNGATCINTPGSYKCMCVNGWEGPDCSHNVDDCSTAACEEGATCRDLIGRYECICPPGKTGIRCHLVDQCFYNPCHRNATCDTSFTDGHAICTCPQGFIGADCSIDVDECAIGQPCEHGGSCINTPGSWKCQCPAGFTGQRCELNINECENNPCLNDGSCLDEKGGYKCICPPGYTGQQCQIDIDECAMNPCQNGATCTDYINSFRCQCPLNFWGEHCEFTATNSNNNNNQKKGAADEIISPDSPPSEPNFQHTTILVCCGILVAVCAVLMVVGLNTNKKIKEKAIVWFPEGFKATLTSRKRDPTDRKPGRGISTLQALGGNFFRGIKSRERTISTNPGGVNSTDIDRCATTPNGDAIYHEPYDQYSQYDQYSTYIGTICGSTIVNEQEPMTPTPMPLNPINVEGPHGLTPLMAASMAPPSSKEPLGLVAYGTTGEMNGNVDNNVTDLLQRGAQLNLANKVTGETALHLAARHGRVDAARGLLERCDSQDVNAQDATGRTPLHTAIAADSLGVFELLIRCRGTDLNAQTNDGTTPLILATKVGTYSMLEELILNECEVTKSDANGKTALHWAAATNNADAIRRLLAVRETNKDAQDLAEETPLFLAAREGAKQAVEILLKHNANKDISDQMDRSPIEIARSRQHYDIVRLLEEYEPSTPRSHTSHTSHSTTNSMRHSSRQLSPFSPMTDSSSSSTAKPLIAEANIIRTNLQHHHHPLFNEASSFRFFVNLAAI